LEITFSARKIRNTGHVTSVQRLQFQFRILEIEILVILEYPNITTHLENEIKIQAKTLQGT
jgi:hypothetical protein